MEIVFSQSQKDELCYLIGDWYIRWKNKLININDKTHNLALACYELSAFIRERQEIFNLDEKQIIFIRSVINIWEKISSKTIVDSYEYETHTFGSKKEILKIMVCNDRDEKREIFDLLDVYLGKIVNEQMNNNEIINPEE